MRIERRTTLQPPRRRARRFPVVASPSALLLVAVTVAVACAAPQLDRRPLYAQLGGEAGLDALVDRFLRELAVDPDAAPHFRGADVKRFRAQLTLHLCQTFDGPCRYEGEAMPEVHRGMAITQREFNAVVEDLWRAMEALRIPTPVQNRVLARLAPMREEIVGQVHPPSSAAIEPAEDAPAAVPLPDPKGGP